MSQVLALQEPTKSRWLDVCAEAAICDRPERLAELTKVIAAILKEEQRRLEDQPNNRFRTRG